jgi:amino acid transporter
MQHLSFDFSPLFNAENHLVKNNILYGVSLAFWNFIGWDNSSTVLDEVHNPNHNYRRSMFINVPIIVFFYFFTLIVSLSINTDWSNWTFGEFSRISKSMGHPLLAVILTIGGMVMSLGLFNSLMLSSTRIFSTMADDNLFPSMFSKIHSKFHTPYIAILFVSVLYSFLVLVDFKNLVVYDVFLYLIAISLEAIALIILRRKIPEDGLHFQIPFGKFGFWLCIIMLFICIFIVIMANAINITSPLKGTIFSILLALSGIPAYYFFLNRRKMLFIKKLPK